MIKRGYTAMAIIIVLALAVGVLGFLRYESSKEISQLQNEKIALEGIAKLFNFMRGSDINQRGTEKEFARLINDLGLVEVAAEEDFAVIRLPITLFKDTGDLKTTEVYFFRAGRLRHYTASRGDQDLLFRLQIDRDRSY